MLEPVEVADKKPGLKYDLLKVVPDGENTQELGETRTIGLNQFAQKIDLKQPFGVSFDGYINIPADGIYEFQVDSTWDTTIVLGGNKMIIDDTGTKDRKVSFAAVAPIRAGLHKISIRYNTGAAKRRSVFGGELRERACAVWKPATCFTKWQKKRYIFRRLIFTG